MTVNLKTIPLKDVPVGGVFIANPEEINMEFIDEGLTPYVKVENLRCDVMGFTRIENATIHLHSRHIIMRTWFSQG